MTKKLKNLGKIIAAFLMSFTLLIPLAACDAGNVHTHVDADGDNVCDECEQPIDNTAGGGGNENPDPNPGGGENDDPDPNPGGGGNENPDPTPNPGGDEEVDIPKVPEGAVQISEAKGDLETCYAIWTEVKGGAKTYNVYVKAENGSYTQIDRQLVRKYSTYYRADAVGLKAGTYTMKVVPVGSDDKEVESLAGTATMSVVAHERAGYAFVNGTASGAYNEDGTLKANATVIYVTDNNKDTVSLEMKSGTVTGLQNILDAQKKEGKPLAVRLIGSVSAPDVSGSKENSNANTLLIKGDGKGGDMSVTFEGIGSDATANGWTLRITSATNVEVRNIGFMNTKASEPDDVTLEKDTHVWVHNCDLFYGGAGGDSDQAKGDGALDTKESSYITHSYNHFWDSGKCNLQNMHESGDWRITYHHNWYDHSDSRHPRIRSATVHVYNNYFDGNAKYGVGACEGANVFVENNYFRSTTDMKPMMSSKQGTDLKNAEGGNPDKGTFSKENGGMIKAFGNKFDCPTGKLHLITQNDTTDKTNLDCYLASSRDEQISSEYKTKYGETPYSNFDTASDMYEYEVDTPEVAKAKVEKYAGRVGGGDFTWEFDDATEDGNSSIITALKTALTNYKSDLVSVDGEVIVGGSTGGSGGSGDTEVTEIEDDVTYIPSVDGYSGKYGIKTSTGSKSNKQTDTVVINGITFAPKTALKMDSSETVSFTLKEEMTLTLYLYISSVLVDSQKQTATAVGNYFVYTAKLSAGAHTVKKDSGENALYMLTLTK